MIRELNPDGTYKYDDDAANSNENDDIRTDSVTVTREQDIRYEEDDQQHVKVTKTLVNTVVKDENGVVISDGKLN